jgi:hypothetical protein
MSRARPIEIAGEQHWFDTKQNSQRATASQLSLLAAVEGIAVDDLLDESLSQGQVLTRLRETLHGNLIPLAVLKERRKRQEAARQEPVCRICDAQGWDCEGEITRHHFIPRWIMRELENYVAYAARSRCTIPICIGRHRDLHFRDGEGGKSIVPCLTDDERAFGVKLLDELAEQHPKIFALISGGDETTYEGQLLKDYREGAFHRDTLRIAGS